jgi:putative signal transducing protein
MSTSQDHSREKLVKVYSTANEMEARMVQEVLAAANIESMINSEVPPSLFPMNLGTLATKDIFVAESVAAEAQRILSELPERNVGPKPAE